MHTKLLKLLLLLFISVEVLAQTGTEVDIEIVDNHFRPLANLEVVLKEKASLNTMRSVTNAAGKVHFNMLTGRRWNLYVQGYLYEKQVINISENESMVSTRNIYLTHDTAYNNRLRKQTFDRKNFQIIAVSSSVDPVKPSPGNSLLKLAVVNGAGKKLPAKAIHVVDIKNRLLYTTLTNGAGFAFFQVAGNNQYDIDVEEQMNASLMDLDNVRAAVYTMDVVYDTYEMTEINQHDTITQLIQYPVKEKNSRAYYSIRMRKADDSISNENVFLDEIGSTRVYRAKTNQEGEAVFILPFGKKFMLHFNYQRDVDVIDLSDARQHATGYREVTYMPDPALEYPELYIPTIDKLTLTGFEYYHHIPYPKPVDARKPGLFLRWGNPVAQPDTRELVLELGLTTNYLTGNKRLPLNMSFVLDISGSMAGYDRIEGLKEGFNQLIQKLLPDDIISIILYNDEMELLLPAQKLGNNKGSIMALVQSISPSGGTNMLRALQTGYEQVSKHFTKNAINAVVLLTDGYDINTADTIIKTQLPFNGKISCTGIGVGSNYNYDLLKQLVTKGGGLFSFAGKGAELVDIFANGIIRNASPVAKDISIEIKYGSGLICNKIYGLQQPQIKNNTITALLPPLTAFMEMPLLISFDRKIVPGGMAAEIVVTLNFTNVLTGKRETLTEQIGLQKGGANIVKGMSLIINEEQKKMYAVAFANECMVKMAEAFARGDIAAAKKQLNVGLFTLKQLYGSSKDADIQNLISSMEAYLIALKNVELKKKMEVIK